MSQQINLYDPALLRKRELLSAANLAAVALLLLLGFGGWGTALRAEVAALEGESFSIAPLLKGLQAQMEAVGKQLAEIKADPRIEAELDSVRALLGMRGEVAAVLRKGVGAEAVGFAEYLRGLARQVPGGLWLTGFSVADGGASMEINGRMTDPALLPQFIARLNGESAFKGRAFAALNISAGKDEPAAEGTAAPAPKAAAAAAGPPPFLEFTLIPSGGGASAAASQAGAATAGGPQKLVDILPPEAGRALGGKP